MKKLFAIGFAALLLVAFTVPAMAKVDVGGIIFTDFYYFSQDNENKAGDTSDYSATRIQVPNITRLKAKWTNENGVGMFIEFGIGDDTAGGSGNAGVALRHAYGWWDVNPGFTLLVGHSTTPFSPLTPTQLLGLRSPGGPHVIGLLFGEFYSGRFPQVRGTFKFSKNARLAIALVDPNVTTTSPFTAQATTVSDNDSKMPRIDIGMPLYFGNVKLYPGIFYHEQTYDDVLAGQDDSITSWGASLGLTAGFGPVTIAGEIQTGENWGNTRATAPGLGASASTAGKVTDAKVISGWLDVGFKLGPATPHVIYGQISEERDVNDVTAAQDWTRTMYGVHIVIPVAKTFLIRPELMVYDYESGVGVDAGKQMIAGVQFMIAF